MPIDTGRKLNVHKTERFIYVQFTSCVYEEVEQTLTDLKYSNLLPFIFQIPNLFNIPVTQIGT